jgi:hypothetical protein
MNYEMFQFLLDTRIAQLMAEAEADRAAAALRTPPNSPTSTPPSWRPSTTSPSRRRR